MLLNDFWVFPLHSVTSDQQQLITGLFSSWCLGRSSPVPEGKGRGSLADRSSEI